jgi:DNA-binding MarR family transcriptional regulator
VPNSDRADSDRAERSADEFDRLFRAVYATFHRRDGVERALSNASRAVLQHLALAGPLTVGEAAAHLSRSQSTTSELLAQLERNGLVERRRDVADARRTEVWLSAAGFAELRRDESVLGLDLLTPAMRRMPGAQATRLLTDLRALVDAAAAEDKEKG